MRKKYLLLMLFFLAMLASCNSNDNNTRESSTETSDAIPTIPTVIIGGIRCLDASNISTYPILEEKTIEFSGGVTLVYYNTFQSDGNFVIGKNGYIKSIKRGSAGLMKYNTSNGVIVYACDGNGNKKDPEVLVRMSNEMDGMQTYIIGMHSNFMIYNSGNIDANIGKIYLWN